MKGHGRQGYASAAQYPQPREARALMCRQNLHINFKCTDSITIDLSLQSRDMELDRNLYIH